jgi:Asp-tRNA(Asn)/Glu-tRNA(Gln) amidotransferase A subunit family amidase
MDADLTWAPAWRVRELVATGAVSAIDVVDAALERLQAVEPQIHAFITVCAEEARATARAADEAVRRGAPLGPLHGVPVSLKDDTWVGGVRATAGSLLFEDFVPAQDGTVAARLKAAGGIVLGKTNVPEFNSFSRTANKLVPECVNPWDRRRSPGASSGGTGANIAAGVTPLGVGSDGGGSVRIPSAANGVVGLFPTLGRIPSTGGYNTGSFSSYGPMARDVRDVAIALAVLSGSDGQDPRPCPPACDFVGLLDEGVRGMRFGWSPDFGHIDVDPAVRDTAYATARRLMEAGASLEDAGLVLEDTWPRYTAFSGGELRFGLQTVSTWTDPAFAERRRDPRNVARMMEWNQRAHAAPPPSRESYDAARAWAADMARTFQGLFERYDAILTPTLPEVPPILPADMSDPYRTGRCGTAFLAIANVLGLPALSYPAGLVEGLPVGLQIIGRPGREDEVLRAARALERLQPFTAHPQL